MRKQGVKASFWTTPPIEDHKFWAYHKDRYPYTVYLSREPVHGWELWVDAVAPSRVKWLVRPLTEESKGFVDTIPVPEVVPGGSVKQGTSRTETDAMDTAEEHVWEVSRW